jgi:tetratricopeptide (TPR) repeat protein
LAGAATAVVALALTACGASTPRQAAVEPPPVVKPAAEPSRRERRAAEDAAAQAAAAAQPATPQSEGRRGRRDRDEPESADGAAVIEPVPEAAAQAYTRALTALRNEYWLEAELELEQLTFEHPQYPGPHVNLAIVYRHDGRRADARKALDAALAIEPAHPAANNELGIQLREEGKFDDAEQAYRRALAADPGYSLAHYNLGVLLDVYLRRPAEALEQYEVYQSSLAAPDETVGRWIIDLKRRTANPGTSRVAQGGTE